jgi:hypothetical protein
MLVKAFIIWLALVVLAVVNGGVRTALILPQTGEAVAHVISTVLLGGIIFLVAWLSVRWMGPRTARDAFRIGVLWLTLTVAFEFLAGHYLFGTPWATLLADYDLIHGRIWPLVLVANLLAPLWAYRMK